MMNWFLALSIRWKLQLGFFMVTMITTIYNRILAAHELANMVEIARNDNVAASVILQLEANHSAYIFNSFWESGIEFALQFFIIGLLASKFVKPILNLCESLKAMDKGDLTKGVPISSQDEFGVLEANFNDVLNKLNHIMREVDASGREMEQSAYQIAKISHEIAEVGRKEQSRSAEVSSVTEQLQHNSADVQQQAQSATERSRKTQERARDGIRMVQNNISEMESTTLEVNAAMLKISALEQATAKIHAILATIQGIAAQTNLLALNAAIEAARAGEQGRGFAVVADEVRKLAERTSLSASEVSGIIKQLGDKVHEVTASMNVVVDKVNGNQSVASETAAVIEHMANEVAETASANSAISLSSGVQIKNVNLLQETLAQLFETLKENSVKVETTAAIGDSLHNVSSALNALMEEFTFEKTHVIEPAQHEKRTYPRISNRLLVKVTQDGKHYECSSLDFSLNGIRLALNEKLNPKQALQMEIFMPQETLKDYEEQTPLKLQGSVNWQNKVGGKNQCGIEFIKITPEINTKMCECFEYFHKTPKFQSAT
jgi:methyl-accepting chemotaxis protein